MFSFLRTRNAIRTISDYGDYPLVEIQGDLLKALQQCELEMLRDINRVCFQKKIDLMVGGGSLLGTVRHQGFIPWDDDIDLMLHREQVGQFVEAIRREYADRYTVQYLSDDMACGFIKIRKKGTTYVELGDELVPQNNGVYLDIFIIEHIPDGELLSKWFGFCCNLRLYIATSVYMYRYTSEQCRNAMRTSRDADRNYRFRSALGFLFSWRSPSEWFISNDRFFSRYQGKKTRRVSIITGRGHYFGEMFPKEVYEKTIELPFEDLIVQAPERYKTYLNQMYGPDYMELPPEGKREHHFVVKIEL